MVKLTVPLSDGRMMVYEGTEEEIMNIGAAYEKGAGPIATRAKIEVVHWTPGSARTFAGLLYGDQAKLIDFLLQRGGAAKYEDLQEHLGLGGQKLAGVLSSLTRNAQKATGMDSARIVGWRGVPGNYEYFIASKAFPLLRTAMRPRTDAELTEMVATLLKKVSPEWMSLEQISGNIGYDIGDYARILGPMEARGEIVREGGGVRWKQETFEIVTNAAPFLDPQA